ncbi:MAG: hypothetical protein FWG68_04150 [Defluviitaleaceae bacterium]|nr:hypothetical protein [Defluviitaleaceae bacterium]
MKKGGLAEFLWNNSGRRIEVETTEPKEIFTGISDTYAEDCGDNYDEIGWFFSDVKGVNYGVIDLKDIARVRLVGETAWAWDISQTNNQSQQKYLQAV